MASESEFKSNVHNAEPLLLYDEKGAVQKVDGNITGPGSGHSSYTKGKVDGSNSFYVVYRRKKWDCAKKTYTVGESGQFQASTGKEVTAGSTSMLIVDGNAVVDFGFAAQSAQGFAKDGITFFQHDWFCGRARHHTNSIASGTEFLKGPSSMIITKGWWTFYKEPNFKGEMLTLNGQTKFGPGIRMGLPPDFCDNVKSIKYSETVI